MSDLERGVEKEGEIDPYLLFMQEHRNAFSIRLQLLMERYEIGRVELAERLGIPSEELIRIIVKSQSVSEDVLQGLCGVFETDPIAFLPNWKVKRLVVKKLLLLPDDAVADFGTHRFKDSYYGGPSYMNRVFLRMIDRHLQGEG